MYHLGDTIELRMCGITGATIDKIQCWGDIHDCRRLKRYTVLGRKRLLLVLLAQFLIHPTTKADHLHMATGIAYHVDVEVITIVGSDETRSATKIGRDTQTP